jgi:hypothetical protein
LSEATPQRLSVTDIADLAGVKPAAVSNWARRHDDFPRPLPSIEGEDARKVHYARDEVLAFLALRGTTPSRVASTESPDETLGNFEHLLSASRRISAADPVAAAAVQRAARHFDDVIRPHLDDDRDITLADRDTVLDFLQQWSDDLTAAGVDPEELQRLRRRLTRDAPLHWRDVAAGLAGPLEGLARRRETRARTAPSSPREDGGAYTATGAAAYFTLARAKRSSTPAVQEALLAFERDAEGATSEHVSRLLIALGDELARGDSLPRELLWTTADAEVPFDVPRSPDGARTQFRRALSVMSSPRGPWGRDSLGTDLRARELLVAARTADATTAIDPAAGSGGVLETCAEHDLTPIGWELEPAPTRVANQRLLLLRRLRHTAVPPVECRDALSAVRNAHRKAAVGDERPSPLHLAELLERELANAQAPLVVLDPPVGLSRARRANGDAGTASDWLQLAAALTTRDGTTAIVLTRRDLEAATHDDDLAAIPMLIRQGRVEGVFEIPSRPGAPAIVRVLLVLRGVDRALNERTDTVFGQLERPSTTAERGAHGAEDEGRRLHELLTRFRHGADVEAKPLGIPMTVVTRAEIAARDNDLTPRVWLDRSEHISPEVAGERTAAQVAALRTTMMELSRTFTTIRPTPVRHEGASPLDDLTPLGSLIGRRRSPFAVVPNVTPFLTRARHGDDQMAAPIDTIDATGEGRPPMLVPPTLDTAEYEVLGGDVLVTPRAPAGADVRIHPSGSRAVTTRPTLCLRITEQGIDDGWTPSVLALVLEYATADIETRSASNPARLRIPASPRGLTAVGIVANQLREIEASLSAAVPQVRELREFLTRSTLSGAIDLMIDQ